MNEKSIEVKILDRLVWTFILCIVAGMVGVAFGVVKVEYMEGLITGCLLTLISSLMKDLFFNDQNGGSNAQTSSDPSTVVSPKPVQSGQPSSS